MYFCMEQIEQSKVILEMKDLKSIEDNLSFDTQITAIYDYAE